MITIKHLGHLNAIIQHGTVHGAAEALHLTQSALTRSLGTLEESLGVRLFDRAKTGMTPTAFCLQIIDRCQQVLLDIGDIQREADMYRNVESGQLHVGVGRAIRELILRETLPEFVSRYPQVAVTTSDGSPEELVYRIKHREVDFLLAGVGSYQEIEGIKHQPLKDIPLSVITGAKHPLRDCKNIKLEQLVSYPLITPTVLGPSNPLMAEILNAENKKHLNPAVLCSDYTTLKAILLRNHSWLLASELQFQQEIASGELCKLDVHHPALVIELSVIELHGRSRSPAAQAFIKLCQEYLDSLLL